MILELKQYASDFHDNPKPYTLRRVESITNSTPYGPGCFAITIFDTRYFITNQFEYVKDVSSEKVFIRDGRWVNDA